MPQLLHVTILAENKIPIRAWVGDRCINRAITWVIQWYGLTSAQLPPELNLSFLLMTRKEFSLLVESTTWDGWEKHE